ncbi:MAG: GAF domain-containing protein [Calditrichaeota bacterium]|nr:MAG: GAF domain-containing protein [Calditrichota bacterium]MBL1204451.1 GAF domain-containing protein [Calditrichota bacterium]NOG44280.1 sigma 54-interacting transcriptional regulator [Calditrichota bacterium]
MMENLFTNIKEDHLEFIFSLTKLMADEQDEHKILDILLSQLNQKTGAEIGAFIFYNKAEDKFETKTVKKSFQDKLEEIYFSETVFRRILKEREAILTFDTSEDDSYQGIKSVEINKIHAILAFPLIVKKELYGIMYFDSRENRQSFNEGSRQLLSFFAPIASLTLEQALSAKEITKENLLLKSQLESQIELPKMVGESPVMKQLYRLVAKVAPSDVSVLINGENGTGKDLVAQAIHDLSNRKAKPFIAQFVGNIPASILESELFGYKKGAFTGAGNDKPGLFEAVNGGTLFLDEIGELTADLQTKLLRVLQNQEIKRLGENMVRKIDVRIIAATNRDLKKMIKDGTFREDLYYRLNVITIVVPPLRERRTDIPLLANHFLKDELNNPEMSISQKALKKLIGYNWPGNVRQLENLVKRACILSSENQISEDDIIFDELEDEFNGTLEEFKNKLIIQRVNEFKGNKTLAAKSLDISLRSLQLKAKELGI